MIYKTLWSIVISSLSLGILVTSCSSVDKDSAQARSGNGNAARRENLPTSVDIAVARVRQLRKPLEYPGTTAPFRVISLRSQVEGRLLGLNVDVGDKVRQNQVIGQVDDTILRTELNKAEAELAAQQSEVSKAITQVRNAQAEVEQKRLELLQAQIDSRRQQELVKEGAIALQAAEQAKTTADTAIQALKAAQEEVRTQQEAVTAAKGGVIAQQAVVRQAQERRSFSRLVSPILGVVTEKVIEPGDLLQPGNEVLKIADFSRVKVLVQVSELELSKVSVGQSVQVKLDAFPKQVYTGKVTRISPAANARLIPVEVLIPNSYQRIGSGLLGRVSFTSQETPQVVIPKKAVANQAKKNTRRGRRSSKGGSAAQTKQGSSPNRNLDSNSENNPKNNPKNNLKNNPKNNPSTTNNDSGNKSSPGVQIFVLKDNNDKSTVEARTVFLGESVDGYVQVLSGLKAGEKFVVTSGSKPLKDGDTVRISIISETE
ncbi:MAG: efflux RND transporter periplasmic adaptor subunit [Cyanobacteria bacterium P01_A01_bin.45]